MLDLNTNSFGVTRTRKDDYVQEAPKQSFMKEVKKKQGKDDSPALNNLSQVLANAQKAPAKEDPKSAILSSLTDIDSDLTQLENDFASLINSQGEDQMAQFQALLEKLQAIEARLKQIDEELSNLSRNSHSNDKVNDKIAESMTAANVLRKQFDSFIENSDQSIVANPTVAPQVSEPKAM